MADLISVCGMVLKVSNYGEYDRRLVVLTLERGKIVVFARGVRRSGSSFTASCEPFIFADFSLAEGREAYSLREVKPKNFFEGLRSDLSAYYIGSYFLELADYYSRENADDGELLALLYQSLKALLSPALDNRLIRRIYEIRAIVISGEFPGYPTRDILPATAHALKFIVKSDIKSLYTFRLSDEPMEELSYIADGYMMHCVGRSFKSLDICKTMGIEI